MNVWDDPKYGGTVAWNQIVKTLSNDNFNTETGATVTYTDGVAEVSSTTASNGLVSRYNTDVIKDHKYLLSFDIYATEVYSSVTLGFRSATGAYIQRNTVANTWTSYATIRNAVWGQSNSKVYLYKAGDVYENIKFRNAMAIDLTAMFGSTIADYIYSLEQADAGAGVAWFRNLFPKDYYPYDNSYTETCVSAVNGDPYWKKDIDWTTPAGTVYDGTVNVVTGALSSEWANIASYNGETINEPWLSSMDAYAAGATPTTGAQVVYTLATPLTYQLTPQEVKSLLGKNNVWSSGGTSSVTYRADTKLYIDNKITQAIAAALNS